MNAFRRWLAILLMFLVPLPAWAATNHCAPVAGHLAQVDAHADHVTHAMHIEHDTTDNAPVSTAGSSDHDADQHASPCCGAVLPAPTCGLAVDFPATDDFPLLLTDFASADRVTLKRPPRSSLA